MSSSYRGGGAGRGPAGLVLSSTSTGIRANRRLGRTRRLRRVVLTAYNQMRERSTFAGFRGRWAMVTLTYAKQGQWEPRQISGFQQAVRDHMRYRRHKLRMLWVAELTQAGRVHYHAMIWLPVGSRLPKPDQAGWWPHGSTRIEWAKKPAGYLAKYVSKGCEGIGGYPKGARTYAILGLEPADRRVVRWWAAPGWVRESFTGPEDDVRPAEGGGYLARSTGEWHPTPWVCILQGPDVLLLPKLLYPAASPVGPSLRPHDWRAGLAEVRTMPGHIWRQHAHLYRTTGVPF